MKKITTITGSLRRCATAACIALALLVGACASDETLVGDSSEITLTTTVGTSADVNVTRASFPTTGLVNNETQIASGQAIDLYIGSNVPTSSGSYSANTRISATAGNPDGNRVLNLGKTYYWPAGANLSFYAYYPAGLFDDASRSSATKSITVPDNQGTAAAPSLTEPSGKPADILYAQATGVAKTSLAVPLTFQHRMVKVSVKLQGGEGFDETAFIGATVTLAGVQRNGTLTAATGTIAASGAKDNVTMKIPSVTTLSNYCLLPPQTLSGTTVTGDELGHPLVCNIPNIALDAGTNLRIILTATGSELLLSSATVLPWSTTTGDGTTNAQAPLAKDKPLTITASSAGTVSIAVKGSPYAATVKYRKYTAASGSWGSWTAFTPGSTNVSVAKGDQVQFAANGRWSAGVNNFRKIECTSTFMLSGNVMSLIYGLNGSGDYTDGFKNETNLYDAFIFYQLFQDNTTLVDASEMLLPATMLTENCYEEMFYDCTRLVVPPTELPATTLAEYCYQEMFRDCSSLTKSPLLPATTLARHCYNSMFKDCTSLTKSPLLPATTLPDNCYRLMFQGCSSLQEIHCNATTGGNGTAIWVDGVSATGTFHKMPGATWSTGNDGIPTGWTNEVYGDPLTIEAGSDGNISFGGRGNPPAGTILKYIKYTASTGQWDPGWTTVSGLYSYPLNVSVETGDKVIVAGNGPIGSDDYNYYSIGGSPSGSKVSGNIMSVVYGLDGSGNYTAASSTNKTITYNYAFTHLFYGNEGLTDASGLRLPATTLTQDCYAYMFYSCENLVIPPTELPAATLADHCYAYMFDRCSSLTKSPLLPATTLARDCYYGMFQGCTTLTKSPLLPATTLARDCYANMFDGCSNLREIRCNATTGISATGGTYMWVKDVNATGTFYKNTATPYGSGDTSTWPINSVHGIPSGWNVETY